MRCSAVAALLRSTRARWRQQPPPPSPSHVAFALCCRVVSRRAAAVAAGLFAFATGNVDRLRGRTVDSRTRTSRSAPDLARATRNRQWLAAGHSCWVRDSHPAAPRRGGRGTWSDGRGSRAKRSTAADQRRVGGGFVDSRAVQPRSVGRVDRIWRLPRHGDRHRGTPLLSSGLGLLAPSSSPERGVLVMTPALLLLLPGCRAAWRVAPWWVRSATVSGIAYVIVQIWVSRFSGGDGFYSYRTPLEGLTLTRSIAHSRCGVSGLRPHADSPRRFRRTCCRKRRVSRLRIDRELGSGRPQPLAVEDVHALRARASHRRRSNKRVGDGDRRRGGHGDRADLATQATDRSEPRRTAFRGRGGLDRFRRQHAREPRRGGVPGPVPLDPRPPRRTHRSRSSRVA